MKTKKLITACLFILFSGLLLLNACKPKSEDKPLRIAISSASENYINWIHRGDSLAELIDLKGLPPDSAVNLLATCDGFLLTGGEDIVPSRYGKGFDSARCETNPARDTLEFALIAEAMKLNKPVFGVCRGQQILNVALGGTLIVDIPTDHPGNVVHRCEDYTKCFHQVNVVKNSRLYEVTLSDTGSVTTNHHQAIENLAPGLRIVAWTADSIPEAIEWENPETKPFLMAVQWHPERMDVVSRLSMPMMKAFLEAAGKFDQDKRD